jgi:hypothetical protein
MSQRIRAILTIVTWLITPVVLTGCLVTEEDVDPTLAAAPAPIDPPANGAPVISGSAPASGRVGVNYSFTPVASDPDRDPVSFRVQNQPRWASFDPSSGALFGMPRSGDDGMDPGIIITVSDASLSTSMAAFSIMVEAADAANQPPQISGRPPGSVAVGQNYSFTPNASDPDGDQLTFSLNNAPQWLRIDSRNGQLSGTPTSNDLGVHGQIIVIVSDNNLSASLSAFSITVVDSNSPPQLSGTPSSQVNIGQNYSFTPNAFDPDGDNLTFSIRNKPAWANNFDTTTGQLSGTPQTGDNRTYSGIVITADDGTTSVSMPTFSITVNQISLGSVTLSWQAPTRNSDGTQLTDLAGYVLHYGMNQGQYDSQHPVNTAGQTTATIDNLAPNTYYFVITAKNDAGVESGYSNEASKTVN